MSPRVCRALGKNPGRQVPGPTRASLICLNTLRSLKRVVHLKGHFTPKSASCFFSVIWLSQPFDMTKPAPMPRLHYVIIQRYDSYFLLHGDVPQATEGPQALSDLCLAQVCRSLDSLCSGRADGSMSLVRAPVFPPEMADQLLHKMATTGRSVGRRRLGQHRYQQLWETAATESQ